MDSEERSFKEDIVRTTMVQQWDIEAVVFELLSLINDEQLDSFWHDITIALQAEQDEKSEAYP
jgi:hypothetical protein